MDIVGILEKIGFDFRIFLFNMINFGLVAFLLYKFVFKKLNKVLEERQRIIQEGVENTQKSGQVLSDAQEKADNEILKARSKAKDIVDESEAFALKKQNEIIEDARAKAEEVLSNAERTGEELIAERVNEFNTSSAKLVVETAKKLIETGDVLSEDKAEQLVNKK